MAQIKLLNFFRAHCEVVGEHRHEIVGEIDLPQSVWYPRITGKHFSCDERYPVMTEIDPLEGETVVEETMRLVVHFFYTIVRQVQSP